MRIRRTLFVVSLALLTVAALAGPASAGGRPDPPPAWMGPAVIGFLVVVSVSFAAVVAVGIASRRDRR
jgi:hypothetical protein